MWADAKRDGRPAEYSCRRLESSVIPFLVPRHKVWLTAAARVPCSNEAKTQNPLKLGCPKLTNRSQPFVGRS